LDFSQLLQWPYVTQMLGDVWADVIKVKRTMTREIFLKLSFNLNGLRKLDLPL
jgi:crotonobetainyl-CoA:carnitine CoA-transferase CaiB-like acyl-CoA transferase